MIHAVGPVWQGGGAGEPELLVGCYRHAMALLRQVGGRSIAFPAISTGVYGFPPALAAPIAVATVRQELTLHGPAEVTFACFDMPMLALYEKELAA